MYDVQYLLTHSNFELSLGQCLPGSFTLSIDTISILGSTLLLGTNSPIKCPPHSFLYLLVLFHNLLGHVWIRTYALLVAGSIFNLNFAFR